MSIEKTEGVILRTTPFRETSLIISFFTKDFGKMNGLLKAARKRDGKFSTSFEPFTVNRIVFYKKRSHLHLVTQCDLSERFDAVRDDIVKNSHAAYFTEILDGFSAPENKDGKVYNLMLCALRRLSVDKDTEKVARVFEIKLLKYSGLMPELSNCAGCKKSISGAMRFSMRSGGIVCRSCSGVEGTACPISGGAVSTIRYVAESRLEDCFASRFGMVSSVKRELKSILRAFITFHIEREPKSLKFIDKLARAEARA